MNITSPTMSGWPHSVTCLLLSFSFINEMLTHMLRFQFHNTVPNVENQNYVCFISYFFLWNFWKIWQPHCCQCFNYVKWPSSICAKITFALWKSFWMGQSLKKWIAINLNHWKDPEIHWSPCAFWEVTAPLRSTGPVPLTSTSTLSVWIESSSAPLWFASIAELRVAFIKAMCRIWSLFLVQHSLGQGTTFWVETSSWGTIRQRYKK